MRFFHCMPHRTRPIMQWMLSSRALLRTVPRGRGFRPRLAWEDKPLRPIVEGRKRRQPYRPPKTPLLDIEGHIIDDLREFDSGAPATPGKPLTAEETDPTVPWKEWKPPPVRHGIKPLHRMGHSPAPGLLLYGRPRGTPRPRLMNHGPKDKQRQRTLERWMILREAEGIIQDGSLREQLVRAEVEAVSLEAVVHRRGLKLAPKEMGFRSGRDWKRDDDVLLEHFQRLEECPVDFGTSPLAAASTSIFLSPEMLEALIHVQQHFGMDDIRLQSNADFVEREAPRVGNDHSEFNKIQFQQMANYWSVPTVSPTMALFVQYPWKNALPCDGPPPQATTDGMVYYGNMMDGMRVLSPPHVWWPMDGVDKNDLFTLLLTDLDGGRRGKNRERVHWMVGNIPADGEGGDVLLPYALAPKYGIHRYLFSLYRQTWNEVPQLHIKSDQPHGVTWSMEEVERYGLERVGFSFFRVPWPREPERVPMEKRRKWPKRRFQW